MCADVAMPFEHPSSSCSQSERLPALPAASSTNVSRSAHDGTCHSPSHNQSPKLSLKPLTLDAVHTNPIPDSHFDVLLDKATSWRTPAALANFHPVTSPGQKQSPRAPSCCLHTKPPTSTPSDNAKANTSNTSLPCSSNSGLVCFLMIQPTTILPWRAACQTPYAFPPAVELPDSSSQTIVFHTVVPFPCKTFHRFWCNQKLLPQLSHS